MLKYTGVKIQTWLMRFYSDIVDTSILPNLFKAAKVKALTKPGKDGIEVTHYRPISLLSVAYKLLERLILNRIQPAIDIILPIEQAGFRNNHVCVEQVLALSTMIEAGYQRNQMHSLRAYDTED